MDKVKVAAYCRVSTNSKDQTHSFEAQKEYFEEIAKKSEKYDLVQIYADKGLSGVSFKKRDQFLQMIHDAGIDVVKGVKSYEFLTDNGREPKFSKILIKDISRFSRNMTIIPLYRALIEKNVSLELTNMGQEFKSESDEFNLNMLLNFAQMESVDRSKKIRWGLNESAKKGIVKMAQPLYGYHYDPETKEVSIVEEEARTVKLIFDMYVNQNLGVRRINKYFEANNFKTRDGNNFGYSTLQRMITNQKYCGDLIYLKYDSGTVLNKNSTYKVRPEEEWEIHYDKIPAIISREIFEKAQELRKARQTSLRGKKNAHTEYSKLLVCGNCGAYYGRNKANGKYLMNCMTKKRFGVKRCDYPNIKVEDLDDFINTLYEGNFYNYIVSMKNLKVDKLLKLKEELISKKHAETPAEYYLKKEELVKTQEQKQKLLDLYLDGNFEKQTLDSKAEEINNKISTLEIELKNLSLPVEEIEKQTKEIDKRVEELEEMQVKKNLTKVDIINMIDRIDIEHFLDQINLDVHFKINETINKVLNKLKPNEDLSEMLEVPFCFSVPAGNNVPVRVPKNVVVTEGTDLRKFVKEYHKSINKLAETVKEYFENKH
ncbi:recombinase family protein [Neobacillus sp. PS3-40]|uniref:recombinase family protein n=1 Tax=Neobacillus sp. PS3-40 TaxID=3070679 RepID=UPI0027E0519E|nr:recombinase family protein [Neobacillus sp. PS3-40]WML44105.1 recombinase family protein [Neobacillus sp. PS3-40]